MKEYKVYLKNNIFNNIGLIVISILESYVALILSDKFKVIFNDGILGVGLNKVQNSIIVAIIAFCLMFIINIGGNLIERRTYWTGVKNIKLHSLSKLFQADSEDFAEQSSMAVWTEIDMASSSISDYYNYITVTISKSIELITYLWIVFNISVYVGVISIAIVPLILLGTKNINNKIEYYQNKFFAKAKGLAADKKEALDSLNNIKSKLAEDFIIDNLDKKKKNVNKDYVKYLFLHNYFGAITALINSIAPFIIIYFASLLNKEPNMKFGQIINIYIFVPLLLQNFKSLYSIIVQKSIAKPYLEKIQAIDSLNTESEEGLELTGFDVLEINNLKVNMGNKDIKYPDIKINKGDRVLLKGPSGSGKSTLFNILLGIRKCYEGNVSINNIDIRNISVRSLREIIGVSFQNLSVFNLTLKDNIELGEINLLDLDSIMEVSKLDKLKFNKELELNTNTLSGGEKARINIAQNLIRNPAVILIDESLSSLQEDMEEEIMKSIIENFSSSTIICISHRSSSEKYFNKIVELSTLPFLPK